MKIKTTFFSSFFRILLSLLLMWCLITCSTTSRKENSDLKNAFKAQSDSVSVKDFIDCIDIGEIEIKSIVGEYVFYFSDYENKIFKSVFPEENFHISLKYHHYGDFKINDTLFMGDVKVESKIKFDPLSIHVHELFFEKETYICMIGKSIAASGTGNELSYFALFKHDDFVVKENYFFESRFADAHNLGDFDGDKKLDYLKLSKDIEEELSVQVINLEGVQKLVEPKAKLKYLGNDKFIILESQFKSKC